MLKVSRRTLLKSLILLNFSSIQLVKELSLLKYFNSILPFVFEVTNFSSSFFILNKTVCISALKNDYKYFPLSKEKRYFVPIIKSHA